MMRNDFPEVKCWAFAPPGGLMTLPVALYCKKWITSVIVGDDMVPRLSRASVEHIFDRMLDALQSNETPKCKILCCSSSTYKLDEVSSLLHSSQRDTLQKTFQDDTVFGDIESQGEEDIIEVHKTPRGTRKLFPPGKVMWLMENPDMEEVGYEGIWTNNTNFSELIVSKRMMTCHFPDYVYTVLKECVQQYNSKHG